MKGRLCCQFWQSTTPPAVKSLPLQDGTEGLGQVLRSFIFVLIVPSVPLLISVSAFQCKKINKYGFPFCSRWGWLFLQFCFWYFFSPTTATTIIYWLFSTHALKWWLVIELKPRWPIALQNLGTLDFKIHTAFFRLNNGLNLNWFQTKYMFRKCHVKIQNKQWWRFGLINHSAH